ncbi:uncharacterized protein F4822DRAFT_404581 [Hypoxylon trugodes]|uniref:uncharacterized protein n=1 Tax=Hypoxylon trugodes TaxID=326681 RepID=UPI002192760D|nr:uncharacterized protein F4822DRAFT_404581 [Hypoxylon trugodes]KAI1388976.1 hypothetical protein F4822DRAFT_404581 [Hypoxylon trugodes]
MVGDEKADDIADVYSYASLTLFADRASHIDDGLFRGVGSTQPPRILRFTDGKSGITTEVLAYTRLNTSIEISILDASDLFYQQPGQRNSQPDGRTGKIWEHLLQEECLSDRRICFTDTGIKWDREAYTCCECDTSIYEDETNLRTIFFQLTNSDCWEYEDYPMIPLKRWQDLIERYTSTNRAYDSKRLVAIAAIASNIPRPPQDYLAGLWRGHLDKSLLWKAAEPFSQCRRITEGGVPSWSWASISGPIQFIRLQWYTDADSDIDMDVDIDLDTDDDNRFTWQILGAWCVLQDNNDPYGPVKIGSLRVRSQVCTVRVEEMPECINKLGIMPAHSDLYIRPFLPRVLELDVPSDWHILTSESPPQSQLVSAAVEDMISKEYGASRILCLLLRSSPSRIGCWERVCYVPLCDHLDLWRSCFSKEEIIIV